MQKSHVISKSMPILVLTLLFAVVVSCAKEESAESANAPSPQPTTTNEVAATPAEPTVEPEVDTPTVEQIAEAPTKLVSLKKEKVEEGYGNITGQILFDGDVPELKLVVKKGDATIKDAAVCAAKDLESNTLLIDPETKGIANAFVYIYHRNIKKNDIKIHPDLIDLKEDEQEIVFDQKNCRFIPHVMVVRTGQHVRIKSADNCAHNTHTSTLFNDEFNTIIAPNDRKGVLLKDLNAPESLPMPVKCDIHPWMKAHWLIINHPYAAVTDKNGRFTIEQLPVGEIEFRIWHEVPGYIDRKYVVNVEEGTTELEPVKVPAAKFEE